MLEGLCGFVTPSMAFLFLELGEGGCDLDVLVDEVSVVIVQTKKLLNLPD